MSITSKLSGSADMTWRRRWIERVGLAEANRISFIGRDRGSMVHKCAETWYLRALNPAHGAAFDTAKAELQAAYGDEGVAMARRLVAAANAGCPPSDMWCQEMPLWIDDLRTAGRVDHVGLWYGVPSIVDYKTSKGPKTAEQIDDYRLQCSFYALAHNALFGTDIQQFVVLITCLSGELQTFIGNVADYEHPLCDRLAFYDEIQAENYLASLAA